MNPKKYGGYTAAELREMIAGNGYGLDALTQDDGTCCAVISDLLDTLSAPAEATQAVAVPLTAEQRVGIQWAIDASDAMAAERHDGTHLTREYRQALRQLLTGAPQANESDERAIFEKTLSVEDSFRQADGTYLNPQVQSAWIASRAVSHTAGMTLDERIAHVGGRENANGYIEFGSVMAVDALIQHALRDAHAATPKAPVADAARAEPGDDEEDEHIQPTPESERAAFNAMMRWHLIRLLQAWRYGGDLRAAGMAAFAWARTNDVGRDAFAASERAAKLAAQQPARASEAGTVTYGLKRIGYATFHHEMAISVRLDDPTPTDFIEGYSGRDVFVLAGTNQAPRASEAGEAVLSRANEVAIAKIYDLEESTVRDLWAEFLAFVRALLSTQGGSHEQ